MTKEMTNPHAKWLLKAAEEIRKEGHTGWGNTCEQAAAEIARLTEELQSHKDWLKSRRLRAELTAANALIGKFAKAEALSGVRALVAGWNGEGKADGPNEKHPPRLGATLPKTDCGSVYELDELLRTAVRLIAEIDAINTKAPRRGERRGLREKENLWRGGVEGGKNQSTPTNAA